jgi:hypothetical protein
MAGRTLTDVQADYTAVHTAYLNALTLEQYDIGAGNVSRSGRRPKSQELYDQMMKLDAEVKRLSRGGIRIRGGTPV